MHAAQLIILGFGLGVASTLAGVLIFAVAVGGGSR